MKQPTRALRGVNLGGWLVVEKWMTPSLFDGIDAEDEYTLSLSKEGKRRIDKHRRTFIGEEDIRWMKNNGVEALRVPLGYWVFGDEEPYLSAKKDLDWLMMAAERNNFKVLLCMHGAPGSQNGSDHSGRKGKVLWHSSRANRRKTIDVLLALAERYKNSPALWGIELLNEPKIGLFQFTLRRFYTQAYNELCAVLGPKTYVVFHDAFTPRLLSGALRPRRFYPVALDIHWYHQLRPLWKLRGIASYFRKLSRRRRFIRRLMSTQPVIIGEWSLVLNGKLMDKYPKDREWAIYERHGQLQLEVYDGALAWFYWSYKTEGRGIWNFRSLVEDKHIVLK